MLGLLWMDDSNEPVARKISEAARCYQLRFGVAATTCYANPVDVSGVIAVDGLTVESRSNILPNHFLVGKREHEGIEAGKQV